MRQYLDLVEHVLKNGVQKGDRTGTGTLSVFGYQMRFPLAEGFPVLTTKKLHLRSIIVELLWFLKGDTNIRYLKENKVSIWDEWAAETGDLGPVYGQQWRCWPNPDGTHVDQISELVEGIRKRPNSRRHLVVAWNPSFLPDETISPQENVKRGRMALAPCHCMFQFYVADGKLSCMLVQRSCDIGLGLGFNIASYALLTHMIAQQCDLEAGDFVWTGGDTHIYSNHVEQLKEQLKREPYPLPKLVIKRKPESIFDYRLEDFELVGYQAHPHIPMPVAV